MNRYLMEIKNYLGETRYFIVEASTKVKAIEKAKQNIEVITFVFCDYNSLKVIKKIQGGKKYVQENKTNT